ncbi:MAG: hemerythrin domain-containing protein [Chthonomonadales bacterium]|nr:hemerythrin domain-containing protein [Chthonomonadales bacterium]
MSRPTDLLEREHHYIQKVVGVLALMADRLEAGAEADVTTLEGAADFLRGYADLAHHGKEEVLLFPLLIEKGVGPRGCPIGALNAEHVEGREKVAHLAEAVTAYAAGRPGAREPLIAVLRDLAEFYPSHIWKEDYLLFPMTNKLLEDTEQAVLMEAFRKADEALGDGTAARYEEMADRLALAVVAF